MTCVLMSCMYRILFAVNATVSEFQVKLVSIRLKMRIRNMSGNVAEYIEDKYANYKDSLYVDSLICIFDTFPHILYDGSFIQRQRYSVQHHVSLLMFSQGLSLMDYA